jgi:hypothetical protein
MRLWAAPSPIKDGDTAGYISSGMIQNFMGATLSLGVPSTVTIAQQVASWGVAVVADNANDRLKISVTGGAAHTVRWVATVRTTEVQY